METEPTGDLEALLGSTFDSEEIDLIDNYNAQLSPTRLLNQTSGNFTNQLAMEELGSSCGSSLPMINQENLNQANLPPPTYTDGEILDPPSGNSSTMPLPGSPSFSPPLMGTPQSYHPSTEGMGIESVVSGYIHPREDGMNPNPNLPELRQTDEENLISQLLTSPNLPSLGTSSFNPLIEAVQPYAPTMENLELESPTIGSSQSYLSHTNSSAIQNPMTTSGYSNFEGIDPSLGTNASNVGQTGSTIFDPPLQTTTQQTYPSTMVDMIPQNGVHLQPFFPERDVNTLQPNAESDQNVLQTAPLLSQMAPFNQYGTFFASQQNFRNNNVINNQLALVYPTSVAQNSTGAGITNGRSSWINQQPSPWLSAGQNPQYRPSSASGSHFPQYVTGNVFAPQNNNPMLYGPSASFWPLQLQLPSQQLKQVPTTPAGLLNSQSRNSMLSVCCALPSPQFPGQDRQFNQALMAPNSLNPQLQNPALTNQPSMQSRPQNKSNNQNQREQVERTPHNASGVQRAVSMPPRSGFSGAQNSSVSGEFSPLVNPTTPNLTDLQKGNSAPSDVSKVTRPQAAQGRPGQTARRTASDPSLSSSLYDLILNSQTQKDTETLTAEVRKVTQRLEAALGYNKEKQKNPQPETLARRRRGKELEPGQSSLSSKRSRKESTTQDRGPTTSRSQQAEGTTPAQETGTDPNAAAAPNIRAVKNAVYDPLFEGIGLPIDPHLRMFSMI